LSSSDYNSELGVQDSKNDSNSNIYVILGGVALIVVFLMFGYNVYVRRKKNRLKTQQQNLNALNQDQIQNGNKTQGQGPGPGPGPNNMLHMPMPMGIPMPMPMAMIVQQNGQLVKFPVVVGVGVRGEMDIDEVGGEEDVEVEHGPEGRGAKRSSVIIVGSGGDEDGITNAVLGGTDDIPVTADDVAMDVAVAVAVAMGVGVGVTADDENGEELTML
jgi:hypothetical protein